MNVLNLTQGSDEWKKARLSYLCASEAPAMMNCSKFMSRNQLLDLKKGWINNPIGAFKQAIIDKGHEFEDAAREILEFEIFEELLPVVGFVEIEGLKLFSSFDGLSENGYLWEHKGWNAILGENVKNGVIEEHYYWQLEQQMLIAGVDQANFMVSDGTENNREMMIYESVPERRHALIAGWHQFTEDLENHEIEAKQEVVVAEKIDEFPMVAYEIVGSDLKSNISEILPVITKRAEFEMTRSLETDQDFANKDKLNKATKVAREKLKEVVDRAKKEFISFSEFSDIASQIDSVLQKMVAHGERQVKKAKEDKKVAIALKSNNLLCDHIKQCDEKIKPLRLEKIIPTVIHPDWSASMKNKRTIESLQNAVDGLLAEKKIEIDKVTDLVIENQKYLHKTAKDFAFLFADSSEIVNKDPETFKALVDTRIMRHKEFEKEKADAKKLAEKEKKAKKWKSAQEKTSPISDEHGDVQTEASTEVAAEESSETQTTKISPSPFAKEMAEWASTYNIPLDATESLSVILRKYFAF